MRWFLLLIPIALAALLLWMANEDDEASRQERENRSVSEPPPSVPPIESRPRSDEPGSPITTTHTRIEDNRTPALEVRVRDDAGQPIPNLDIKLRQGEDTYDRQKTNEEGIAEFYTSHRVNTVVFVNRGWFNDAHTIGRWDGRPGRKRLEATLYRPRNVILRVLVDGRAGLPEKFVLQEPRMAGTQTFAEAGEIRGQFTSFTRDVPLTVKAAAKFLADPADFVLRDRTGALEATLRYETGVAGRLHGPQRKAGRDLRIETQSEDGTWGRPFGWTAGPMVSSDEDPKWASFGLMPGHHRLVLHTLGIPVKEFAVAADAQKVVLRFDHSKIRWVEPRCLVPPGYVRKGAVGVTVHGHDVPPRVYVPDKVRFLHPGDRELVLTVSGPGLRPHPKLGVRKLSKGERVVLRAIADSSATLRCDGTDRVKLVLHSLEAPYRVEFSATSPRRGGGLFMFPDAPAGTFHAAIYPHGSAPTLLEAVQFGELGISLGTIETGPGTRLDIDLKNRAKKWVSVRATWLPIEKRLDLRPRAKDGHRFFDALPPGRVRLDFELDGRKWSRVVTTQIAGKSTIEVDCAPD